MEPILAKKKSFHELNTITKLSRRRRRRRPFTEHQSDLSTRPVSLTQQQQSLTYLGLLVTYLVMLGYTEFSEVDRMQLADDV